MERTEPAMLGCQRLSGTSSDGLLKKVGLVWNDAVVVWIVDWNDAVVDWPAIASVAVTSCHCEAM